MDSFGCRALPWQERALISRPASSIFALYSAAAVSLASSSSTGQCGCPGKFPVPISTIPQPRDFTYLRVSSRDWSAKRTVNTPTFMGATPPSVSVLAAG